MNLNFTPQLNEVGDGFLLMMFFFAAIYSVVESSARVVEASKELSKHSNELEEMLAKHEDVFGNMVRTMKGKKRK